MGNVFDDFGVTSCRLRGIRGRGERRGRMVTRALQPHSLHFPLFRFRELSRDYDQAEVDHEERADDYQENEVYPVPEGVGVLHVIHYVRPSFQTNYKKYGNPGETDVIERNCSLEWIVALALALGVVVVPINAGIIVDVRDVTVWHGGTVAHQVSYFERRQITAGVHPAVIGTRTNVILTLILEKLLQIVGILDVGQSLEEAALAQYAFPQLHADDTEYEEDEEAQ